MWLETILQEPNEIGKELTWLAADYHDWTGAIFTNIDQNGIWKDKKEAIIASRIFDVNEKEPL